ncbi:hypothetical protein [Curtobacterium sp. CFBP9011]|uniref:hypothetical protein n=1 Tax=Curtobacterium sp. CFBP9011 TaxID=3096530 RepID=UPI002A69EA7B|nr:hypothetical protein [Curtobacterium sp. CFBP9011]MDY1003328.1 hypothetical protein [Curtobacterium sp. CFBP9011]
MENPARRSPLSAADGAHFSLGGSADPVWRPELVRGTRARLQTVDQADHALEVAGDWRASQRLQADVLAVVEERVATI